VTLEASHRRFNPLTRDWVLVSPQRAERPWLGQTERMSSEALPAYDPTCYLCPRNERAGGVRNADYKGTFVFDNDFPPLLPEVAQEGQISDHPLLEAVEERGLCRVVCFSPRHDLTLPELELPAIQNVIATWAQQIAELKARDFVHNVQVFENKGEMMGCSNPHPHSQIWAQAHTPNEIDKEVATQSSYWETRHRWLLLDYAAQEHRRGVRVVAENDRFVAVVPFWAIWPFEVLVIALRPCAYLTELMANEILDLADVIKQVTTRYDNLFESSFPYSMGIHQAPFDGRLHPEWTLHAHFYPPLLRSATVRKFMVGYEMLAMPQRDITPESAAARLRAVPAVHYKKREQDNENVP
jgi:UDPglucose--hexose-1-phosphate uridylyltransferase